MKSKNVIRINESQLKQMISESVKKVLKELDWKTKINAANKASREVNNRLFMHGLAQIDQSAGGYHDGHKEYKGGRVVDSKQETKRRLKQAKNLSKYADEGMKQRFGKESYYNNLNGVGNEYPALRRKRGEEYFSYYPYNNRISDEEGMPTSFDYLFLPDNFKKDAKEIHDFYHGNYEYQKGKGWQLRDKK